MTVAEIESQVRAGNLPQAVAMARRALDAGLSHPMLLNLRSHWHDSAGRTGAALADLRAAFALAPGDVYVRNALALLLARLGRGEEAVSLLKGSIRLAPDYVPAYYALGWLHAAASELDAARAAFEAVAAREPGHADALAQLASLAARRADWDGVEDFARRALAANAGHPVALTALAGAALGRGHYPECAALLDRIGDPARLQPVERGLVQTVRADLYDAEGRYDEAFALYARRNHDKFAAAAPRFDSGLTMHDYLRWMADYFAPVAENGWAAAQDPPPGAGAASGHVFLVGFPRSGTTLLENILASHSGIASLDECDTLGAAAAEYLGDEQGRARLAAIGEADIVRHRALYWQRVRQFGADVRGRIFVDKYPLSSVRLPLVAKLFPQARVLFALRDPRDVLLSCFRRSFALNPSMFELLDLERGARLYAGVMELAALYRTRLGLAWHPLRYEDLVADFEAEMAKVCAFIGVPWDAGMRDFARNARGRTIKTPSSVQVLQGLYGGGAGQWRHYRDHLGPAIPHLAPWIAAYGYPEQ